MLISKISEETEGVGEGHGTGDRDLSSEYQTASELFELMTKNQRFEDNDEGSLTTQDLVLLYKNIDIGTQLMTDAHVVRSRPNQHVETIVYNGESDSDISENYSNEDIHNVFKLNQERMHAFDDGSFDNILCHKLGGLEIQSSDITTDYNRQFLFKDPFIREQLQSLDVMASCSEFGTLPTSLLDYICCKRLEDNYNFYMDNIIRYVQHTIEQLKRISNGDYLTDRAKEKWEEVNKKDAAENSNTKVLATSTSIPLHVECKTKGNATWDDIVHSEVDVRSLSKILEKKIIVEIPKLICGYSLYSKRCADNLIIGCKRDRQKEDKDESRVEVVLQLQRSQTGQVISNISSIMILQTTPAVQDLRVPELLPIEYKIKNNQTERRENEDGDSKSNTVTVIECINDDVEPRAETDTKAIIEEVITDIFEYHGSQNDSNIETNGYPFSDTESAAHDNLSNQYSTESSVALRDILDKPGLFEVRNEATFNLISPDELRVTMQRLNMQSSVPEESAEEASLSVSCKKKSPTRVRIKSPYENQSIIMEEKKRKRLLEIREKREKKKLALGENAKISKHKYGKVAITPQASSSVTKLSITNKSFYNSIYGQNVNIDNKAPKTKPRKGNRNDLMIEVPVEQIQKEYNESPNLTPEKNSQKYINRSYYLDDTETEVMFMQMKNDESQDSKNTCSASTSAVSKEFSANLTLLSQLIGPSDTEKDETDDDLQQKRDNGVLYNNINDIGCSHDVDLAEINQVPKNSPKELDEFDENNPKKAPITLECRKSIDKLYHLMKKLGKASTTDLKTTTSKLNLRTVEKYDTGTGGSTVQGSDSGTSLKHHLTSSNPSCFSFGKVNADNPKSIVNRKKTEQAATVVPKVIISSKLQAPKVETDKLKKDRKKVIICPPPKTVPENPLKAISQLLHVFDNVQKTREKNIPDPKLVKKIEITTGDGKTVMSRQGSFRRRSRLDHHLKENDQEKKVTTPTPREKRLKPLTPMEIAKIPHQQIHSDEKHSDKVTKKKIADIIDEAKEARGEAVRGPSKNSRLNSLAQPKRTYVQAHSEEFQLRYGKNLITDRLQRLATTPPTVTEHTVRNIASPKSKVKRESTSSVSAKQLPPPVRPIDKSGRMHRSASSSPNRRSPTPTTTSHKHAVSDTTETIKKMVAVESYVASHYGRTTSPAPLPGELLLAGHKSRVPLVPNDIELASLTSSPTTEEANELGNKLHRIIDSMITSPLAALAEGYETPSKISRNDTQLSADNISRDRRTESDYNFDVLEDKNLETAVETVQRKWTELDGIFGKQAHELQPYNSTTELEKLENALYNQISGTFQKRLRIKNLTLTPKQSMQQVFLLQSGDAGSLLVKSVSNLKINKCDAGSIHDLKAVPVLSNSHLNWKFAQIPMQISTVGYAYPHYQPDPCSSTLNLKSLNSRTAISEKSSVNKVHKSDKISQCFKGIHQEPQFEKLARVEMENYLTVSKAKKTSTNVTTEISEESLNVTEFKELPENKGETVTKNSIEKTIDENPENLINKETKVSSCTDDVDYTTSLDMLVGLLNEIQKITCQKPGKCDLNCTEIENVLVSAATRETDRSREILSITSLDKMRQLESNPSIYSFYISSDGSPSSEHIPAEPNQPIFLDKEVNVNLCEKEYVNNFTDVPSGVLPITVNHSTNVTDSLIGVISEPSNQSMVSFNDLNTLTLYSNTFFNSQSIKRIIELPEVELSEKFERSSKKTDLNEKCYETAATSNKIDNTIVTYKMGDCPVQVMNFDSTIKFKRDVLVTVYSILVFTIFAALSFSDMAIFEG